MNKTDEPAQVFDDLIINVSKGSFTAKVRTTLIESITEAGGCCVENFTPRVDYVICAKKDQSDLVKKAAELKVPLLLEDWINESIEAGDMLDERAYFTFPEKEDKGKEKAKPKRVAKRKRKEKEEEEEDEEQEKAAPKEPEKKKIKIIKKGRAAVDPNAPSDLQKNAHVYEEGKDVYDVMLNQTDISYNQKGHNKFYALQLLESDDKKRYYVYTRWGRVGAKGQMKVYPAGSLSNAKHDFEKRFSEKTANDWDDRDNFKKVKGKYVLVERDFGDDDGDDIVEKQKKALKSKGSSVPDSVLDERVQEFVSLICNLSMMQATLVEMEFDINKMPLGKLKKAHVQKGYEVLKKIEKLLGTVPVNRNKITELANTFYSLIPHDFGMSRPPPIDSKKTIKKKIAMLEALGDIEIATSLLKGQDADENPIDSSYKALNVTLNPLDRKSDEWRIVDTYINNTHAPTHTAYTLELKELFAVERPGEKERFKKYASMPNHQLLWHGSRLTNFVGILSQGLRIAPPEAPVTGYMFGKGLYFADLVTKSANYCHSSKSNPVGVMLLSRVALGKTYDCLDAEYMEKNKPGCDSTKGCGATIPDPAANLTLPDGLIVPYGKPVAQGPAGGSLLYNEFIVYDVAQCIISYLVVVKFKFH